MSDQPLTKVAVPPETFTLPSYAKINLHLRVLGKRDDGFHDLCTVFQTVSLHDSLTFTEAAKLSLTCDSPEIPAGGDNLVLKAAKLLAERLHVSDGARIHLEKRIPSPGGLGGGSSNAAVTLVGLSRLWKLDVDPEQLNVMAAQLGSDVPFFLTGGTCLGTGRGTELAPLEDFTFGTILIVTPNIRVPTAEAFADLRLPNLTSEGSKRILKICRFEAEAAVFRDGELVNDFESLVFARYPEIERAKYRLLKFGARSAALSGSGASVFGIFDKEEARQTAMKALDREVNWRKFAVAAVSRDQYREQVYSKL